MAKSLHERRKITFAELGALYGVLGLINNKLLVHTQDSTPHGDEHGFNMAVQCRVIGCGSVGCIGGTMAQIMGMNDLAAISYVGGGVLTRDGAHSPALTPLFFPVIHGDEWKKITLAQAAKAIRNFLKTGKPAWKSVVGR